MQSPDLRVQWEFGGNHIPKQGLETMWVVSSTRISRLVYAILAVASGTVYALSPWQHMVSINLYYNNYCSSKTHFTPCYDCVQNDQITSVVFHWPLEWALFQALMLELVYCVHIVTSAFSSYHCTEINDVDIIDSSLSRLEPSEKDSLLSVDCCKCEIRTWWWSWSSGWRGGPPACRRWNSKNSLLSFLDGSLQYFFCDSDSIYVVTHILRLLLTKLGAFSLRNLDPNGLGILMTNNANISETQCTIQKYFRTFRYCMHS